VYGDKMKYRTKYHYLKKLFFYSLLFQFLVLSGCQIEEVLVSTEPQFIVDSFLIRIDVKNYPEKDSLWSNVSFEVTYHLENYTGTLNTIDIIAENYGGISICIDYFGPQSTDKIYSFKDNFWFKTDLSGLDYLFFKCQLSGDFWSEKTGLKGKFDLNKDIRAIIYR
jgi:hypothetical protein